MRPAKSFRLTVGALLALKRISERLGISQTAVIELAIRKMEKGTDKWKAK